MNIPIYFNQLVIFYNPCVSIVTAEGRLSIWSPLNIHHQPINATSKTTEKLLLENEEPEVRVSVKDEGYLSCEFSSLGNLVAVADQCGYAYVYEITMPLPKLSQICRTVIRKHLMGGSGSTEQVKELHCIPKSLQSFLSYNLWT